MIVNDYLENISIRLVVLAQSLYGSILLMLVC